MDAVGIPHSLAVDEVAHPLTPSATRRWLATFLATCTSLTLACVGAGVLSFPWALSAAGLPAFLLLGAVVLASCWLGMRVLSICTLGSDAWCYERVLLHVFGPRTARVATLAIVLQQLGSMVGFLVAVADLGAALGVASVPLLASLGACVLWPLSLLPSLQSLWLPSALSIVAVCAVAGVVVARAARLDAPDSKCPAGAAGGAVPLDLTAWPADAARLLEAVPVLLYGFNAHLQLAITSAEARHACHDGAGVMRAAIPATLALCAILYATTAVAGVVCYGAAVSTDVLSDLGHSASTGHDPLAAFAGGAMALHLILAFPIILYPLLVSTTTLLGAPPPATATAPTATAPTAALPLLEPAPERHRARLGGAARSAAVVATTVAVALAAGHRLNVVFSAIGGTVGSALVCWFPAALIVADPHRGASRRSCGGRAGRLLAAAALAALGVVAFAGTIVTLALS